MCFLGFAGATVSQTESKPSEKPAAKAEDPSTAKPAEQPAEKPAEKPAEPPALDVDPNGRPSMRPKEPPGFYLWRDEAGWHLRTHVGPRAKRAIKFQGTIAVDAGKITSITGFEGLETKKGDRGELSGDKKRIDFNFVSGARGEDGFDFQVSEETQVIHFKLLYNGNDHPEVIQIGAKSQAAPSSRFSLLARPITSKQ